MITFSQISLSWWARGCWVDCSKCYGWCAGLCPLLRTCSSFWAGGDCTKFSQSGRSRTSPPSSAKVECSCCFLHRTGSGQGLHSGRLVPTPLVSARSIWSWLILGSHLRISRWPCYVQIDLYNFSFTFLLYLQHLHERNSYWVPGLGASLKTAHWWAVPCHFVFNQSFSDQAVSYR